MSPQPIHFSIAGTDLSTRFVQSTTVVASPATAAEVIVAQVTVPADVVVVNGVWLTGWASWGPLGTGAASMNLRLRQGSVTGTVVQTTGNMTQSALASSSHSVVGVDSSAVLPGQVYCLTATPTGASGATAIGAVCLTATVV